MIQDVATHNVQVSQEPDTWSVLNLFTQKKLFFFESSPPLPYPSPNEISLSHLGKKAILLSRYTWEGHTHLNLALPLPLHHATDLMNASLTPRPKFLDKTTPTEHVYYTNSKLT